MEHGCNAGHCGCAASAPAAQRPLDEMLSSPPQVPAFAAAGEADVACINGIALHTPTERPPERELRQRACTELLRQAAQRAGLLDADDQPGEDGVISEAAAQAIEQLLAQVLQVDEPQEAACLRYFETHALRFAQGERLLLRHVLFAVTPGVEVRALAQRAEALLLELRCANDSGAQFSAAARQWSNCPSGQDGGELGWLKREDCAPEFAREVFATQTVGVLPRLVHSRFGLHIVEVRARKAGTVPHWEQLRPAVAQALRQQTWLQALQQYLQRQAKEAGVALDITASP